MTRATLLVVAMLMLAGCQAENPAAPADPFLFGPTRVAPPGTGAITPQPGLSSNRPAAAGVVSSPVTELKTSAVLATSAPAFGSPVQTPAAGVAVTPVGDQIRIPPLRPVVQTTGSPLLAGMRHRARPRAGPGE